MRRRKFLLFLLTIPLVGCATTERQPIHQVDHARYQYHSSDSGSGYLLGYDEDGRPIYGRRRTHEEEKWWRDSHDEYIKSLRK